MTTSQQRDFLSFGDALFLYLEREGTPLHIASVAVFDGPISLDHLSRHVQSKLPQIPRYLQRVVLPPLGIGPPSWEFASNFKMSHHVREITLKRGTEAELKSAAAAILSPLMDRSKPLWDLTLVHGLARDRTALIFRIHHCLADGISGIGLLNTMLDVRPHIPKLPKRLPRIPSPRPEPAGNRLIETAMQTWFSGVEHALTASNEVLQLAQRLALGSANGNGAPNGSAANKDLPNSEDFARLCTELIAMPDRLPFNIVCRGPQRFEWTSAPFADLRAIKAATGATINDIVLSILTGAFRRYSELRGVNVGGRSLRIIVPVSVRSAHNAKDLGNHITFIPVNTPLGVRDPLRLLSEVHANAQFGKSAHLAELVGLAGTVMGTIPPALQAAIAPILSELPISVCNTICTNVPGPKFPLYLLGRKMVSAYPYVPIGGEMGINVAALTYDSTAYFGFTGDVHAAPKLEKLAKFVDQSFSELRDAVGVHKHPVRVRARKHKSPRPEPPADVPPPPEPNPVAIPEPPTTEVQRKATAFAGTSAA